MDKRNWKLIYTRYAGLEKKAVELISGEMGSYILRDPGMYTIHVLACEQTELAVIDKNAVILGLYDENARIRAHISGEEVPEDGYVVKVMDNPELPEHKLVLITARTPVALYYGAVDFVDDYFALAYPRHAATRLPHELFQTPLPDYYNASAPAIKTRSVFTWGHPINNYREYIENMARLRLNHLIVWNDFAPLNAREVVDYAHEFGIRLYWGFAWGWSSGGCQINLSRLDEIRENAFRVYEAQYRDTGADGIYFQSFTERKEERIDGKLIAETVTEFVNATAAQFLGKYPELKLQFGLHATSVKDRLDYLAAVDPRIEILWEDCGCFPYHYTPRVESAGEYRQTEEFTDRILKHRPQGACGMLYKGCLTLDWHKGRFVHQAGPYVMGMSHTRLADQDRALLAPCWREFQSAWIENGRYAYDMTRHIYASGRTVTLGLAAQLAGGIWLPQALCAQIFWECDKPYDEILAKVLRRRCVDIV